MEMEYKGLKFTLEQKDQTYIVNMYDETGYKMGRCHGYVEDCSFNGATVKAMVIGCVLTQPEGRRGGLARKMFELLDPVIRENNVLVSYLHPFSFPYYRTMGYERVSDHRVLEINIEDLNFVERYNDLKRIRSTDDVSGLDYVYNQFSKGRNVMLRRYGSIAEPDKKLVVPSYMQGGPFAYDFPGRQYYMSQDENGQPDGYVKLHFEMPLRDHWLKDGILHVDEMCFTSPAALRKLMGFLRMYEGQYDYVRFANVGMAPEVERLLRRYKYTKITILPDISGRVHDVGGLLAASTYPKAHGEFTVKVTDSPKSPFSKDLTQGVWHVAYGDGVGTVTRLDDNAPCDLEADMPAFAQLVHGFESYGPDLAKYMHGVQLHTDCYDFFRAFPNRPAGGFDLY